MYFNTFLEALEYVWALPLGVGKLLSIGGGGYLVTKVGESIFGTSKDKDKDKDKTNKTNDGERNN